MIYMILVSNISANKKSKGEIHSKEMISYRSLDFNIKADLPTEVLTIKTSTQ